MNMEKFGEITIPQDEDSAASWRARRFEHGTDVGEIDFDVEDVVAVDDVPEDVATMTDGERASVFAQTGDARYLTPELAHRLTVGAQMMREVPGATGEDIVRAAQAEREMQAQIDDTWDKYFVRLLRQYGLDAVTMEALPEEERIVRLVEVASLRVLEDDDVEDIKEFARECLRGGMVARPELFHALLQHVLLEEPRRAFGQLEELQRALEDVRVLVFNGDYLFSGKVLSVALQELQYAAQSPQNDANAFMALRVQAFARDMHLRTERGWIDREQLAPVRITPEMFGVWDSERERLYVAPRGTSASTDRLFDIATHDTLSGRILRNETEGLAPYEMAVVDEDERDDITDLRADIFDGGMFVEDFVPQEYAPQEDIDFFVAMQHDAMRTVLRERLHIALEELTIAEQWYLLQYLQDATYGQTQELATFFRTFGTTGARTFLSMEHGGQEMGDKIIAIGDIYTKDGAQEIFQKYAELADVAQSVEKYLAEQFGDAQPAQVQKIAENLLLRGKKVLERAADALSEVTTEEERRVAERSVVEELQMVEGTIELFKETVRFARANGMIERMTDLRDAQTLVLRGQDVAEDAAFVESLQGLAMHNHGARGTQLFEKFRENLTKPGAKVYVDMVHDTVAVFMLALEEGDVVELNMLNYNSQFANIEPGREMFDCVVKQYGKEKTIVIKALPRNAQAYINYWHFVGTGVKELAGRDVLTMVYRPEQTVSLPSRAEVRAQAQEHGCAGTTCSLALPLGVLPREQLAQGYEVTLFFDDKKNKKTYYFLRKSENDSDR